MELSEELIKSLLSGAGQMHFAQFTLAFTLAAFVHSGRVKKEIKAQFSEMTNAFKEFATALREDLKEHGQRIKRIEGQIKKLNEANGIENKE